MHDGFSYNPDAVLNHNYLSRIGRKEFKAEKELERVRKWSKKMKQRSWETFVEEMREGLDSTTNKKELEGDSSEGETTEVQQVKPRPKPKTEKKKFRRRLALLEMRRHEREKIAKKNLADLNKIKQICSEIENEEDKRDERLIRRKLKTLRLRNAEKLSPFDYRTSQEVSGCLRTLEVDNDLLHEKHEELQRRKMVVVTKVLKRKPRKRRSKRVAKR
ncbi:hypothetical protein ACOME3_003700 [Neoechinorhynchus agilis]